MQKLGMIVMVGAEKGKVIVTFSCGGKVCVNTAKIQGYYAKKGHISYMLIFCTDESFCEFFCSSDEAHMSHTVTSVQTCGRQFVSLQPLKVDCM